MILYVVPLLATLTNLVASAATITPRDDGPADFKAIFEPVLSPGARLYLPGDPDYFNMTERWSNLFDPSYIAAIQPATEGDVQSIIKAANEHEIPFLATGSAHSVKPGYTTVKNAVNIDLSQLKNACMDYEKNTITIGPGVLNSQVYDMLYNVKKELPLSTDRCISTLGTMIGGGLGTLYSIRGILADSLVSAHVVTATGELVTASATENPGLFWAIRGAGHNFGIITSATFKMYDQTSGGSSVFGDFVIPNPRNASAFELLKSVDEELPPGVFWGILGDFNHTTKQPELHVRLLVFGDDADAAPHLDKIMALDPEVTFWKNTTWNTYGEETAIMCNRGWNSNMYSMGLKHTDVDTMVAAFTNWSSFSAEHDWFKGLLMIERHSETTVLAVPEEERGVFPWRDTKIQMVFVNYIDDPKYAGILDDFIQPSRAEIQSVMGFENHHSYVNEAYGDEGPEVWYGAWNLPRLVELKQQWDPKNQFGPGMPIPLSL
ncbi:6-hydroxy-D-nicotine oxidase [Aspergillus udagawae]|uniref:6-hydroxy-D-nicotine oxidase n=1 Tax=Aspergillus udagawae TaxID=91492 RepID=A0A8H3XRQ7_9EURO|nr:6-hydroxy-D-nicotine oxidase [Aspergillus udagawae]